jgi:hypothetical protein
MIINSRNYEFLRRIGSRHQAQKFQNSLAMPPLQARQDFLLLGSFQDFRTFVRHHGQ